MPKGNIRNSHESSCGQYLENFPPMRIMIHRTISLLISLLCSLVAFNEATRLLFTVYLHRLIVAVRETIGLSPFEPLSRCPRHVNLVVGRPSSLTDVQRAIRTIHDAGVERVTVSHDGFLSVSDESCLETVSKMMGTERLVSAVNNGCVMEDGSQPDAILILGSNPSFMGSSISTLQLPKCTDGSMLYYSELMPVHSLEPSDIFLAVSVFQSKTQRFGR